MYVLDLRSHTLPFRKNLHHHHHKPRTCYVSLPKNKTNSKSISTTCTLRWIPVSRNFTFAIRQDPFKKNKTILFPTLFLILLSFFFTFRMRWNGMMEQAQNDLDSSRATSMWMSRCTHSLSFFPSLFFCHISVFLRVRFETRRVRIRNERKLDKKKKKTFVCLLLCIVTRSLLLSCQVSRANQDPQESSLSLSFARAPKREKEAQLFSFSSSRERECV